MNWRGVLGRAERNISKCLLIDVEGFCKFVRNCNKFPSQLLFHIVWKGPVTTPMDVSDFPHKNPTSMLPTVERFHISSAAASWGIFGI